jgi:hypothetical protein
MPNTSPISASSSFFSPLRTSLQQQGVTPAVIDDFINQTVNLINGSDTLKAEINDLTGNLFSPNWGVTSVLASTDHNTDTNYQTKQIEIRVDPTNLDSLDFVGSLAYELGHAEDPQYNTQYYNGNSLDTGAEVAMGFLTEGKSVYNNIQAQSEIQLSEQVRIKLGGNPAAQQVEESNFSSNKPTQAILQGASALWNSFTTGGEVPALPFYWAAATQGPNAPSPLNSANLFVLSDLQSLNMANASNLQLTPSADNKTISMTISFKSGSTILSYTDTFGNYGAINPASNLGGGQGNQQPVSPSPSNVVTYQAFNFSSSAVYGAASGSTLDLTGETVNAGIYQGISDELFIDGSAQLIDSYNLKYLKLGSGDDDIRVASANLADLKEINAGGGTNTLDLSALTGTVKVTDTMASDGQAALKITTSAGSFVAENFKTIVFGSGAVAINSNLAGEVFKLGSGAADVRHAGQGSVVDAGTGQDTFDVSNNVLIARNQQTRYPFRMFLH